MAKKFDSRQVEFRAILQQLFPYASPQTLTTLLQSINSDLTPPLKVDATNAPSLTVNVGPAIVANAQSNRKKSIPFVNNTLPSFTSGTVTFPSSNGGTITATPGSTSVLNLPVNDYAQALLSLDTTGNIIVSVGMPNAVQANAAVPAPVTNTLPFAYVTLFNNAGTVQNITQNNIFQFVGSGTSSSGGSSSNSLWIAKEVGLTNGTTSLTVNFTTAQPDLSYVIFAMMENLVDINPQYQQVEVTNKTVNGFVLSWNAPLDTGNYFISYIIPPKVFSQVESPVSNGANSLNSTLPLPQGSGAYGVISMLQNVTDANPQFQTLVNGANTGTNANLKWNVPTDSANYVATYMINATGQVSVSNGATSALITLPVPFGTPNYAIVATMHNATDPNPEYQPLLVTSKGSSSVTISWPNITDTANYILTYYVISLT